MKNIQQEKLEVHTNFWLKNLKGQLGYIDNIKINIRERDCECVNWILMLQDSIQWWNFVTVDKPLNFISDFLDQLSNYQLLYHGGSWFLLI